MAFQQYFSYIMVVSFLYHGGQSFDEGNQNSWRKLPTYFKPIMLEVVITVIVWGQLHNMHFNLYTLNPLYRRADIAMIGSFFDDPVNDCLIQVWLYLECNQHNIYLYSFKVSSR
jgi:hypothetical protein